ncbi:hypothetical protein [Candidatus Cardinium hertigii]|uniref:Uncharacterized protein n=1 Tax=Candidatus Cardinium hertigii TaxID=247481 RepID=A0A2Z3LAD9_9BACT|nr:hypothetical protein [Candidatus Cardinium hertigii]AWN82277.1 hypothetical protein DK880_00980 [Candidatus Cardinium hertigii]
MYTISYPTALCLGNKVYNDSSRQLHRLQGGGDMREGRREKGEEKSKAS